MTGDVAHTASGDCRDSWDEYLSQWKTYPLRRREFIGGSDLAAIVGENPYRTNLDVWFDKMGHREPEPESDLMFWGNQHEATIVRVWADWHPWLDVIATSRTWRHASVPWLAASPDAIVIGDRRAGDCGRHGCQVCSLPTSVTTSDADVGILEAKNVSEWIAHRWEDGHDCPDYYIVQAVHNARCVGASWAVVCGLIGGNRLNAYAFEQPDDLADRLHEQAAEFWAHVESGEAPPVQLAHEAAAASLQRAWTADPDSTVELAGDALAAHHEFDEAVAAHKAAGVRLELLRNTIREAMGEATEATVNGATVYSWRAQRSFDPDLVPTHIRTLFSEPRLNVDALRKRHKAIADAAMVTSNTRKFLPKRKRKSTNTKATT